MNEFFLYQDYLGFDQSIHCVMDLFPTKWVKVENKCSESSLAKEISKLQYSSGRK